jgi:hypothetical protein
MAYEEFLRKEQPRFRRGRLSEHPAGTYTATQREACQKKLKSFIGENGIHSVLGHSDNRRTSKMSAPRGEREKADVTVSKIRMFQRLPRNQLQILTPLPQQEEDVYENRWGLIVSSVALLFEEQGVEMLRCRECKRLLH